MVEPIMYLAIGFLVLMLLGLMIVRWCTIAQCA